MIRVLWLVKGLGQGGMERLLVTHAKFADRDRIDYRIAYLVDRPHTVVDELSALDVPVERLGNGNPSGPRWLSELIKLVRREKIDVVHAHSPMPASMARPVLKATCPRVQFVYTEHNSWNRYATSTRIANKITFPFNIRAFAVSDDCLDSISPKLRGRTTTLIHGIDVPEVAARKLDRAEARAELGVDDDTVVVGTVANLRLQKNYPLLLRAAVEITAEFPNVVFVAVGQGPLEGELDRLHCELGLGDRFRFLGFRADVHRIMSAFDIFCLSSDFEGLPISFMEATALDLPVVATAVGGLVDVIDDGNSGLLVEPGSQGALAGALRRLVASGDLRGRMSAVVAASADRFSCIPAIRRQEQLYRELVSR